MSKIKTYDELITIPTWDERLQYCITGQKIGMDTFGVDRIFNQMFLHSSEWKQKRNRIIVRDTIGQYTMDLAFNGVPITDKIFVHHINPITIEDIQNGSEKLFADWNLICVSNDTHNKIHWAASSILTANDITVRTPNDTCPWKG